MVENYFYKSNGNSRTKEGGVLGMIGAAGLVGVLVAGTVDLITTGNKELPVDQLILGSVFEILVKNESDQYDKIIVCCTDM